jgi:hypothetical protein
MLLPRTWFPRGWCISRSAPVLTSQDHYGVRTAPTGIYEEDTPHPWLRQGMRIPHSPGPNPPGLPTAVRRGRATGSRPLREAGVSGTGRWWTRRTRERHSRTTRRFPHRTGPLAKLDVVGLLHAMLEREAGEGFFRRVAAEPRPLLFGDPESGFYARFPLRRV